MAKYQRFNPDIDAIDVNHFDPNRDLNDIRILINCKYCINFGQYKDVSELRKSISHAMELMYMRTSKFSFFRPTMTMTSMNLPKVSSNTAALWENNWQNVSTYAEIKKLKYVAMAHTHKHAE